MGVSRSGGIWWVLVGSGTQDLVASSKVGKVGVPKSLATAHHNTLHPTRLHPGDLRGDPLGRSPAGDALGDPWRVKDTPRAASERA